jgi:hypothetical protein
MGCKVGSHTEDQVIIGMEGDSDLAGDCEGERRRCRSAAALVQPWREERISAEGGKVSIGFVLVGDIVERVYSTQWDHSMMSTQIKRRGEMEAEKPHESEGMLEWKWKWKWSVASSRAGKDGRGSFGVPVPAFSSSLPLCFTPANLLFLSSDYVVIGLLLEPCDVLLRFLLRSSIALLSFFHKKLPNRTKLPRNHSGSRRCSPTPTTPTYKGSVESPTLLSESL